MTASVDDQDERMLAWQLGRPSRGVISVAHRCPCGAPDVVQTRPRLPDGTPFPTLYYLTCPRLSGAVGRLEGAGRMRQFQDQLQADPDLAARYLQAHQTYLQQRQHLGNVPEIEHISAGGMPNRVKCLHVLIAHALACGPGVNPIGDEVLGELDPWWQMGSCTDRQRYEATVVEPG